MDAFHIPGVILARFARKQPKVSESIQLRSCRFLSASSGPTTPWTMLGPRKNKLKFTPKRNHPVCLGPYAACAYVAVCCGTFPGPKATGGLFGDKACSLPQACCTSPLQRIAFETTAVSPKGSTFFPTMSCSASFRRRKQLSVAKLWSANQPPIVN